MKRILVAAAALMVAIPAGAQTYGGGVYFPPYQPQGNQAPVFIAPPPPPPVYTPPVQPLPPLVTTRCQRIGNQVYCTSN